MKPTVLIAAAGPPRPQMLSISSGIKSAAMVPLNGKPLMGWILDELIQQELNDIIVLKPKKDHQLQDYIESMHKATSIRVRYVESEKPGKPKGLANSILVGLESLSDASEDLLVILGHTVFKDRLSFKEDWVMYGEVVEETSRWCYVDLDERKYVSAFVDKPDNRILPDKALIGLYYFKDRALLLQSLRRAINEGVKIDGRFQLSTALSFYKEQRRIKAVQADTWYDCGSITGFHRSKRKLILSRSFNSILVDENVGVLTKKSKRSAALHQEYSWYASLPQDLIGIAPRVISYQPCKTRDGEAELSLEYYGYSSLEEAWVYKDLHKDIWLSILKHVFAVAKRFWRYRADLRPESYMAIYWDKTNRRMEQLRTAAPWGELLSYNALSVDGAKLQGYQLLKPAIQPRVERLYNKSHTTVIHGDLHFANILYDINSRLIKLIDPRGSFGDSGIFGDCKYDMAKLRHSISGGYNFIVNDLFQVSQDRNKLSLEISRNPNQDHITAWFDNELRNEGFDVEQIKLIEGLLFLSMLPLHSDNLKRQLAMFITGIKVLNEVVNPGGID